MRATENVPAQSRVRLFCAASIFGVWMMASSPTYAQESMALGTLSADSRTFQWSSSSGDGFTGTHEGVGLSADGRQAFAAVFTSAGLVSGGRTIDPSELLISHIQFEGRSLRVEFSDTTGVPFPEPLRWTADQAVAVGSDEFWPGDIVSFNGAITVAGEVSGDIVAIGCDVTIREGAVVRGVVIVIGGILRQRGDAKIYGAVFAPGGHRRPRLSISRAWQFEEEGFGYHPEFSYDRVDGLRSGLIASWRSTPFTPRVLLGGAYAFASETWQYRFEIRQRLSRTIDWEVIGSVFRLTETEDDRWIGRNENTLFALLTGTDHRDYIGTDGGEIRMVFKNWERTSLSATYRNVDLRWLTAESGLWHLFRPRHDFRSNFSTIDSTKSDSTWLMRTIDANERRSAAMIVTVSVDPKKTPRSYIGFNGSAEIEYEIAGGGLSGDFDYDRIILAARGWWDTGRWHRMSVSAFYGVGRRQLPIHKLFYLGGVGSLRGYTQKSLVGDEAFLLTAEYRFSYWENEIIDGALTLFADAGRASTDDDFWNLSEFKTDVGFGLGLGDAIRIDVAKGLDRSDRDIKVTIRLTNSF